MDSNPPKLVFLTSRFPYPLNKGDKLRAYYQIKGLSEAFEVHLVCLNEKKVSSNDIAALKNYCHSIACVTLPWYKRILSLAASLWKSTPLQVAFFYSPKTKRSILKIIEKLQPDFIHCHLIRTTEYVKHLTDIPVSLDYMDAFSAGMLKRAHIETNPFKKRLFHYEYKKLLQYEQLALDFADKHFIISDQDKELIPNPQGKPIHVIPNGVDFEKFFPRNTPKQYDLLFMGNMSYPPNIVAVRYLIKAIMPLVWNERPSTNLLIAGIGMPNEIKNYANERVTVQEHFADISDAIACAEIMLAPMLISIGLQNKIIQAMAMKVPCIVSPLSNNPIGAVHNEMIIEADSATEFTHSIISLITNDTLRETLAQNAYDFVRRTFSWQQQNALFIQYLHS